MSIETRPALSPALFSSLKHYEVIIKPDEGGFRNPSENLNNTAVVVRPPIELAPIINPRPIPRWDMAMEMNRFIGDINKSLAEGISLDEAVKKSAQELEMNIRAFGIEIIRSRPVLPHLNRFDVKDGELRMVGNNGEPIINGVSRQERNGAVSDASISIENTLIAAPDNTFAVLMSPSGWNGFVDKQGRNVAPHLNTQTLIFWKDKKGKLKGLTLHNDLKIDQTKTLMQRLGVSPDLHQGQTERDQLANIVRNPASMSLPERYANPFDYVLDEMIKIRGSGDFRLRQLDDSTEFRSVNEVREDISRFDQLLHGDLAQEQLYSELKALIIENSHRVGDAPIQAKIIEKIRNTLLTLTRKHLQDSGKLPPPKPKAPISTIDYRNTNPPADNFDKEIAFLQTRAGCPQSSNTLGLAGFSLNIEGGITTGKGGGVGGESDFMGSLSFPCPHDGCKKPNKRPYGELITNCQHCGKDVRC